MYVSPAKQAAEGLQLQPVQGLGWWWNEWYTIWTGKKWLPARKISASLALEWKLDQMEKNWNQHVRLYRHDGKAWRAA